MKDNHTLIAFIATLAAIVILCATGKAGDAVVVGLVGVLGTFRPSKTAANVQSADTVNVRPE